MFPTRTEIDTGSTGHRRPTAESTLGPRSAIGSGSIAKRRLRHAALPRIAAPRGWRATFMSI